jgi:hypothetical protein
MCGFRYTGVEAGNGNDCSTAASLGGAGSGLFAGLGSRGGGLNGPVLAGDASRKSPSGVSRPERSPLRPRCACLREPVVIKAPRLVLRPCPRSSDCPVGGPRAEDVLRDIPVLPDISST